MKRYDNASFCQCGMKENENGKWVKWEDSHTEFGQAADRIEELTVAGFHDVADRIEAEKGLRADLAAAKQMWQEEGVAKKRLALQVEQLKAENERLKRLLTEKSRLVKKYENVFLHYDMELKPCRPELDRQVKEKENE